MALILVVSTLVACIAPECAISLYSPAKKINVSSAPFNSQTSLISAGTDGDRYLDVDNSHEDDYCGGESSHICDHCHFGHCGVIVAQIWPRLLELESPHWYSVKTLVLKSFISNLYKPPIA